MNRVLQSALDRMTTHRVRLGQVRLVELQLEWLAFRNGEVTVCNRTLSRGIGVRVLDGGWGYAASQDFENPGPVVDRAVALASETRRAGEAVPASPT